MSLLDKASLVLVPSGYKEDVVYSQIPTDGSGDLTFTRASNATRVNSAGLVEVTPWNLLQYSEEFNSGWTLIGGGSFTSNAATAPNGTTTADEYDLGGYVRQYLTMPLNNVTFTFYVRAKTSSSSFRIGILGTGDSAIAQTIETVGTSWTQMSVTYNNFSGSAIGVFFNIQTGDSEVYIWGAQLNIGATAKPYFPTTDRLNVPRLTYQNGGGGCPSLLLEKQSTNILQYSEQMDNAYWTKAQASVTANAGTSPDGYTNADKIIANTNSGYHAIFVSISASISSGTTYTFSFFAKAAEYSKVAIRIGGSGYATQPMADVNLSTGAIISEQGFTSVKVENYGSGWYRISGTYVATSSVAPNLIPLSDSYTKTSDNFNYTGDGTSGVLFYGTQHEDSSYPTSYIPTTSASATRVADACFKTGISSLIGQSEGVFYAEFTVPETQSPSFFSISDGSSANRIIFGYYLGALRYYTGSSTGAFSSGGIIDSSPVVGQVYKIAVAYKNNDFVVYKNGTNTNTLTTFTVPSSLTEMDNQAGGAGQYIYASVKEILLFPTRLTNAELASLTTL